MTFTERFAELREWQGTASGRLASKAALAIGGVLTLIQADPSAVVAFSGFLPFPFNLAVIVAAMCVAYLWPLHATKKDAANGE